MDYDNKKRDVELKENDGINPETATNDLREILAAGGESKGILAQRRALLTWADRIGRKFKESSWIKEARVGGLEHLIWHDTNLNLIRKATYGGCFGRTVRLLDRGLIPGSPLDYLDRWSLHNTLFGEITKISAVYESPEGEISLFIQQVPLVGELPDTSHISDFMKAFGFTPVEGKRFAWVSKSLQVAIFDARPANFVLINDTPIPFDLITVPLTKLIGVL